MSYNPLWYTNISGFIPYVQSFLNDQNNNFSNSLIDRVNRQIVVDIGTYLGRSVFRQTLEILANQATYALDEHTNDILRVTYLGLKMESKSQGQMQGMSPVYKSFSSRPFYYSIGADGYLNIRLFPVPSSPIHAIDERDFDSDTGIRAGFMAMATSNLEEFPDDGIVKLPGYIGVKVIKDGVLSKLLAIEGPGQDLKASKYFKAKFMQRIELYKGVMDDVTLATTRELQDIISNQPYRIHRPVRPSNFGIETDDY